MSDKIFDVAVVIPSFKAPDLLRKAVESLLRCDLPPDSWEAVVVDTSPDDRNQQSVEEIAAIAPFRLRCVRKNPEGPGPSRNLGVEVTRSRFIAFMDSDCEATPGWLRAGLAAFDDDKLGIVQGRTMPNPEHGQPSYRTWHLQVEQETPYYETANVFYRRTAFEGCGGFPADLNPTSDKHMGGEDVVAAWRVKRSGWKTRFAEDALVYHALIPWPIRRNLFIKHYYVVPWLVAQFPELRRFFYLGYFLNRGHALALLGLLLFVASGLSVLLGWSSAYVLPLACLPYAVGNLLEPGRAHFLLRFIRIWVHLLRDSSSIVVMLLGSIRFRCIVL